MLKDDTLGLGAKRNNGDECTGLDAFQHLLGRLNGKTEEVLETERKVREDMKLSRYFEQKFGAVRFVRGGWLVGDQLQMTPDEEAEKDVAEASESAAGRSKKRKAEQDTDRDDEKARKKEKKEKRRKADSEAEADAEPVKEKKDKKKSKKRTESEGSDDKASAAPAAGASLDDSSAEVKKAKKDKKEKREKKEKKEKRKKDRTGSDSGAEVGDSISKEKKRRKDGDSSSSAPTPAESSTTTPSGSGYSTPVTTSTRYLARSRFIAQKRMAFADAAALNQVRYRAPKQSS